MKFLWVFDPDAILTLPLMTALLWALGGSGVKWLRRFFVPLVIMAAAWSVGAKHYQCLSFYVMMLVCMTPGYGDDSQKRFGILYWPYVFLVGGIWASGLLPLVFFKERYVIYIIGIPVVSLVFGLTMLTSKRLNLPKWKIAEMITGGVIGFIALQLIK